jgi:hypothetical protein
LARASNSPAGGTIPSAAEPEQHDWLHELAYVNRLCLGNEWLPWVLAVYANTLLIILLYGFNAWASDPLASHDKQIFLTAGFVDPIQDEGLPLELATPEPLPIEQPQDEVPLPLPAEEIPSIAIELLSLETAGEDADEPQPIELEPLPEPEPLEPEPPAEVEPLAEQAPDELEQPDPEPPAPAHAVESGNFLVWSEPMMPIAGEPYSVFVRIRVPDRITRYPRSDLTGIVIGSDGYQKLIRDTRDGFLPLVGHTATIVIPIVGATRPEADTLILRSRLLKQQKTIRLLYRPG